jgi:hypothetical protein
MNLGFLQRILQSIKNGRPPQQTLYVCYFSAFYYINLSVTQKEEYRFKVCDNQVLKKITEPKRDEITEY